MSRVTYERLLKVLNSAPTGEWLSVAELTDGLEAMTGDGIPCRDSVITSVYSAVSSGHAQAQTKAGRVTYQITPSGQNWITKYGQVSSL
ncbi:MAG: hypothetical protein WBK28_00205 [Minisyncoccia bacterium]